MSDRGEVLAALWDLVKVKRPAGLVIPEPLYSDALDEVSRVLVEARETKPFPMDRLALKVEACVRTLRYGASLPAQRVQTVRDELGDVIRQARSLPARGAR